MKSFFSKSLKAHLTCILLMFLLIQPAFDYAISGNTLTDLTSTTLASEVSYWYLSSYVASGVKIYQCGSTYILGGYNILGGSGTTGGNPFYGQYYETTYIGLPSHNQINLQMTIYAIDSWSWNDHFTISFDGMEIFAYAIVRYSGSTTPLCGNTIDSEYPPFTLKVTIPHIDSQLTLRLTSNLDEYSANESLGFRNIVMQFVYEEDPETTLCGVSSMSLPDKPCSCSASNQYMSPVRSGTCINCDSTCATCTGSSSSQCLSCPAGNTYFKDFQCLTCDSTCATCDGAGTNRCTSCIANYYLVDNTCYPTCNSPLYPSEISDELHCKTPCPGQYAYWDSTCSTTCPYPLVSSVVNSFSLCTYPCAKYEYLYWNGTCSAKCEYPYQSANTNNRFYCLWPCAQNQFLYWDNTCGTACDLPLVKYSIGSPIKKDFCAYPCDSSKYLYWNGTCADYCVSPFVIRAEHGRNFCDYPCSLTQFLYFNGSCLNSCPSPFSLRVVDARSYCDYGCTNPLDYLYWNQTCGSCNSPFTKRIEAGKRYCDYGCTVATDFFYWDGSCQSRCTLPLIQSSQGGLNVKFSCVYPCGEYQYLFWNGSCGPYCPYPYNSRTTNQRLFCDFPCALSEFSYWNGTCSNNCPLPFLARFEGSPPRKYCDYPCSEWMYLRWDGTCGTCTSPYVGRITNGKRYCDLPCAGVFTYWDGSCQTKCDFPLVKDINWGTGQKFCLYPCGSVQYLYWNGTCQDYCNAPYFQGTVTGRKTCNYLCSNSDYLFYNRTCMSSCTVPFKPRNEFSKNYCDYPCKSQEYLLVDGSCQKSCDSPYIVWRNFGSQFCLLPCKTSEYYYPDSMTCKKTCSYPYKTDTNLLYNRCLQPVNPDFATAETLNPSDTSIFISFMLPAKMMHYLRYLNVEMHPRLERITLNQGSSVFSTKFGIPPQIKMQTYFWRYISLDQIYLDQNLKPSFLINFWNTFLSLIGFIVLGVVCLALEKIFVVLKVQSIRLIIERLRIILIWNFPIMILATNIDQILLFAILEYKTLVAKPYSSVLSTLSFLLCTGILGILIGIICLSYSISKRESTQDISFNKKEFQACQVIHEGFQKMSLLHQMFFVAYMMRIGVPMIIAICCVDYPIVCCLLQLLISCVIVKYITKNKPFKKRVNYYQIVIYEFGVLILNVLVCVYTFLRVYSGSYNNLYNILATSILVGTIYLNILICVFLGIKVVLEIMKIHREMKKQGIRGLKYYIAFLQVFFLYLQAGGMGFEELINYQLYKETQKGKEIFPKQSLTERSFLSQENLRRQNTNYNTESLEYSFSNDQSMTGKRRGIPAQEGQGQDMVIEGLPFAKPMNPKFEIVEPRIWKPEPQKVKEEVFGFDIVEPRIVKTGLSLSRKLDIVKSSTEKVKIINFRKTLDLVESPVILKTESRFLKKGEIIPLSLDDSPVLKTGQLQWKEIDINSNHIKYQSVKPSILKTEPKFLKEKEGMNSSLVESPVVKIEQLPWREIERNLDKKTIEIVQPRIQPNFKDSNNNN